jgi:P27 family predicted phage terminase small subunit
MPYPRTPTALKKLRGNPGKRPLPKNEPKPRLAIPDPPKELPAKAKKEWRRIAVKLHQYGLLSEIDGAALGLYCDAYARWVQAQDELRKNGLMVPTKTGGPKLNPWLIILNKSYEQMRRMLTEFGMTPASRSKVSVAKNPEDVDPMEEVLFGKPSIQ